MTQAATTTELPSLRMTFDEFHDWLGTVTDFAEWVDGEVQLRMSASYTHQSLLGFLSHLVGLHVTFRGLGDVLTAPFLMRLPQRPSGREPDLLFLANENLGRLGQTYVNGPADLAVEIVSPDSIERDYDEKYREYAQNGVREYWCIDPEQQSVRFCQLNDAGTYDETVLSAGRYDSMTIAGFWLHVEWLWQKPHPLREALSALGLMSAP